MTGVHEAVTARATVLCSADTARIVAPMIAAEEREHLIGVFLNRRHRVLAVEILSIGTDGYTVVDPRYILRRALLLNASAFVLAHNHPSGDPEPSAEDYACTRKVRDAAKVVGLTLLDHVVVSDGGAYRSIPVAG